MPKQNGITFMMSMSSVGVQSIQIQSIQAFAATALMQEAPAAQGQPVNPAGMPATAPVAATPGGNGTTAAPGSAPAQGMQMMLWLPLLLMLVFMVGMSMWSGRKEKKKREELMSAIKRGDKVQTYGGIIGTVHEDTGDEIVLRVEEGRIRFAKSSIQNVLQSKGVANSTVEAKDNAAKPVGV
jgi:preprotein translocase subunit YajC